jgi:A/G-specific adenine glycosylase
MVQKAILDCHTDFSPFRQKVLDYYSSHARTFPWRETTDPYRILVSEFMLQQTQTERVLIKYDPFMERFPDVASLATSTIKDVLGAWQGLGYNRRAIYLKDAAGMVVNRYRSKFPESPEELVRLPGVGRATAGAVIAFAFNRPTVFIETNIRRVFLHFFFPEEKIVHDRKIVPLVEQTLDQDNPRHWYYALMDYGAMLRKGSPNPNRKSAHYTRQAPFEGSDRKIRGMIVRQLLTRDDMHEQELINLLGIELKRAQKILLRLEEEGFLVREDSCVRVR